MRLLLVLMSALFVGCPVAPIKTVTSDPLRVEGALAFGGVYLGATKRLQLTVTNPNRTTRSVELIFGPPFSGPHVVSVAGGQSASIDVTFTP